MPQGPAKRKRGVESESDGTSRNSETPASAVKKQRRTTKNPAAKPPKNESIDNPVVIKSEIPWPDHFKWLEKVHRSLNLVFTFCCKRKHLATTFETLKSAVENNTKKELTVEDIAQIKFLVPKGISFAYVDEGLLQVDIVAPSEQSGKGRVLGRRQGEIEHAYTGSSEGKDKEILLFEFIDGDLKPTAVRKGIKSTAPNGEMKTPVFSTAQMMELINKRNIKFTSAVNAFLNECAETGLNPVEIIRAKYHPHIPITRASTPQSAGVPVEPAEIPKERKSIADIIKEIKSSNLYTNQIMPNGHRIFPPQTPIFGDLSFALSQSLVNALYTAHDITRLYSHQVSAINNLHDGHHVIVSTSTSSGKSLIYQIPFLHELEKDRDTKAIFVFPTKALAQDQRRSLVEVLGFMEDVLGGVRVETFDGDTLADERRGIREEASVIFTNPDMLHLNILPHEEKWRTFLKSLKFVVVDELHVYNGLFGSHVAFIMRRLRRICAALGNNDIKFISCSATIANPKAHMRKIFGIDSVALTEEDGSPAGRKEFLCWNTPFKDPADPSSGRVDPVSESAKIFAQLILRGVRTIAFCKVRKVCELLLAAVGSELQRLERGEVATRVMAYRGGYTPQDRRRIEKEMFEGRLMGIVATNALELGVDIGSLDAVVMVGFPYTISNLRQQSGRAGRRNKDSLSILVGDAFPTDQYYMNNPDEIFTRPNAEIQVDLENMLVREGHVQCAAFEMPIKPLEDRQYFGQDLPQLAEARLIPDKFGFYHCHDRFKPYPPKIVAIRDTEEGHFAVIDTTKNRNTILEEIEPSRAIFTLYEGGIFLHQGYTYLVKDVNPDMKLAKVELVNVDWTTQPRDFTDIDPVETEAIRTIPGSLSKAFYGKIRICSTVFGYFKIDKRKRILDAVEIDSPPLIRHSKGMWLDVPKPALEILRLKKLNMAAAIHAAEHAVLSLMPNFVISMPGDVRTECKVPQKEFAKRESTRKRPARLTFYDSKGGAGGSGISTKAFEWIDLLLRQAVERVELCKCTEGCVECVASERCKHQNAVMSKAGSYVVLRSLLGMAIDIDALPEGSENPLSLGMETVVPAEEVHGVNPEIFVVRRGEECVLKTQDEDEKK